VWVVWVVWVVWGMCEGCGVCGVCRVCGVCGVCGVCWGVGGVGVKRTVPAHSLRSTFHRLHLLRLWTPTILFLLYSNTHGRLGI
jgi:hypothetical protein